jgi:hypothetical protein
MQLSTHNLWIAEEARFARVKKQVGFLLFIFLVMALPITSKSAWAEGPPDWVEISGPGLDHPIVITDPDLQKFFYLCL